jgi:hypothetical protein
MGFLDHSTNNIIVDAVLTDVGREKLADASAAKNFIVTYSFADDEIDYSLITKYGVIVGKEKIEKNTPVFEASTNAEFGVTSFLATSENSSVAQPVLNTTATQSTLDASNEETSITIGTKDDNQIIDAVAYDVVFDKRYMQPIGNFKAQRVKGSKNKYSITVEANQKEDKVVRFKKSTAGQEELKRAGKTNTDTRIKVKSNTGKVKDIPMKIDYK